MKSNQVFRLFVIIFLLAAYGSTNNTVRAQNKVSSPEQYFGFQMGEDRKLARWDKIVEYFYHLENESGKLKVINMGPSSEGHPFLVCIISSEKNL